MKHIKSTLIFLFLLFLITPLLAQKVTQGRMDSLDQQRIAYINAFKDLAVLEMYKSGIPASITLAQGLLESASGTSFLAKTANNHFGMKCGDRWDGAEAYKHDDEFDKKGDPVKSCFRSYSDPADNFADHSDFLRDPQKHNRYGSLFLLDPLDYVIWSTSLQASGYSPVGHYSARLIEHIERYRLHELDYRAWDERQKMSPKNRMVTVNGVNMVRAVEGETLGAIAAAYSLNATKVSEYNENHWDKNEGLVHGTPIYLEEKKARWEATELEFYFSQEGKSMFEISQLFGIKTTALRQMNGITATQEPALKAKVRLQGQRLAKEKMAIATSKITSPVALKPRNKKPPMRPIQSDFPINSRNTAQLNRILDTPFNFNTTSSYKIAKIADSTPVIEQPITEANYKEERTIGSLIFHEVEKGDTLMNICRKFGVELADLRKLNNIPNDNIQIGQRLRVK